MKQAIIYSLKVWSATAIVSSIIAMVLQSVWLDPGYQLSSRLYPAIDWLIQLAYVLGVDLIFLLPMAVAIFLVAGIVYVKGRSTTRVWLYLTVIVLALFPNLLLIWSELKDQSLSHELMSQSGIGFILNGLACTIVALTCVKYFKLNRETILTHAVTNSL